ncbi:hypothetical protein HUU39_23675 [candidate division KSB1 bacterium]|nr:hypothetical protein [bacterium]NUM68233.1 hypothetical protein [candidate division KSB1 bacterium]
MARGEGQFFPEDDSFLCEACLAQHQQAMAHRQDAGRHQRQRTEDES